MFQNSLQKLAFGYKLSSPNFYIAQTIALKQRSFKNFNFTREAFAQQQDSRFNVNKIKRSSIEIQKSSYSKKAQSSQKKYQTQTLNKQKKSISQQKLKVDESNKEGLKFKILSDSVVLRQKRREQIKTDSMIKRLKVFWQKQNIKMKKQLDQYKDISQPKIIKQQPISYLPFQNITKLAKKSSQVWSRIISIDIPQQYLVSKLKLLSAFEMQIQPLFYRKGKIFIQQINKRQFQTFFYNYRQTHKPKQQINMFKKLQHFILKLETLQRVWVKQLVQKQISQYNTATNKLRQIRPTDQILIDHGIAESMNSVGRRKVILGSKTKEKQIQQIERKTGGLPCLHKQKLRSRVFDMIQQKMN